jgi:hypothetical protein
MQAVLGSLETVLHQNIIPMLHLETMALFGELFLRKLGLKSKDLIILHKKMASCPTV